MTCHLYRNFDADGRLLYVGISISALTRLDQHRLKAFWFNQIASVKIEKFPSVEAAALAEKLAIQVERPIFNIVHAFREGERWSDRQIKLWNWIIEIEPQIWSLFLDALHLNRHREFCANSVWYSTFKPRLMKLVGFNARNPALKHPETYEVAYSVLYQSIPDCWHEAGTC